MRVSVLQEVASAAFDGKHQRVANRRLPAPVAPVHPDGALLQRKARCACGGGCLRCETVGRKAHGGGDVSAPINLPRSGGERLPVPVQSFFESRFNHDFDRVRLHTDARAAESAHALNARAYTVGHDVAFASGEYQPDTPAGRKLLAHELTHTIQQRDVIARQTEPDTEKREQPEAAEAEKPDTEELIEGGIQDAGGGPAGATPADDRAGGATDTRDVGSGVSGGVPGESLPVPTINEGKVAGPDAGKTPAETGNPPKTEADKAPEEAGKDTKPPPKPKQTVCFTYDDGPQKGTADVLNAHAGTVPATFFLTGQNMASNPATQKALVERMLKEGHQLGNHTFTHTPMTSAEYKKEYGDLSDPAKLKKFQDNYDQNEQHFRNLLGSKSPIFKLARLPGNGRFVKIGGQLVYVIATGGLGMAHVTWHFEFGTNGSFGHLKAKDWQGIKGVASETNTLPGANAVILLHDRHWSGKQSLVEAIIKTLQANGFTFGKIGSTGKCG